MRHSKFLLILFLPFLSLCKSKTNSNAENKPEQIDKAVTKESFDSLDVDTSSFIVKNFPDPIKQKIYSINNKLIDYIHHSYVHIKSQDSVFSFLKLKQLTLADSFKIDTSSDEIDSSAKKIILWKHIFNKREQIEYSKYKHQIKILIASQLWSEGKKYELLWIILLPEKKDETAYINFQFKKKSGIQHSHPMQSWLKC